MSEIVLTRITRKGQMTIPQEIREAMGIEAGDCVVLRPLMGGIFISKASLVPQVQATDVLRYLVASLGRAAEQRGICQDEDLDPIIEEIQQQTYQEHYGR